MAFKIKEWLDRIVEHPTRRTITDTTTGVSQEVDVSRAEGEVTQEGTPLGAVTFNDLESRIATAFDEKQDTLIAGDNITIENNIISATGGGTASNEFALKLHIDENTEGLNSAINLNDLGYKLKLFRFNQDSAMYKPISPFSYSGDIYWLCDDPRIQEVRTNETHNMIKVYLNGKYTKAEYEQIIADNPITIYLFENDIEETQRYYGVRLDSKTKVGYYENRFCYVTEKTNKIENGYVDFVRGDAYDSTTQRLRAIDSNFSIDSLVNKGYIINEVGYSTGTTEINYDGVNSYLNRKFEEKINPTITWDYAIGETVFDGTSASMIDTNIPCLNNSNANGFEIALSIKNNNNQGCIFGTSNDSLARLVLMVQNINEIKIWYRGRDLDVNSNFRYASGEKSSEIKFKYVYDSGLFVVSLDDYPIWVFSSPMNVETSDLIVGAHGGKTNFFNGTLNYFKFRWL